MVVSCCIHISTGTSNWLSQPHDSLYLVRRYFWRNNSVELAMLRPYSGIPMDFQCCGILLPPMPCFYFAQNHLHSFSRRVCETAGQMHGKLTQNMSLSFFWSLGERVSYGPPWTTMDHHGPPWTTNNRASCFGQAAALSASLQRFSEQVRGEETAEIAAEYGRGDKEMGKASKSITTAKTGMIISLYWA